MLNLIRAALLGGAALLGIAQAEAATLVALTADNQLIRLDSETRRVLGTSRVSGADGRLIGMDQRPANGMLYGLTDRGQIVTLDPATGRATQVSRLSERFESGGRAVVDFNPAADRLRVMGVSRVSLRVNVETGQAIRDGELKYTNADLAGTAPRITAGAYTNSVAGTQSTALYTLDTMLGSLNIQSPPNDGVQAPRARLSMSVPAGTAFDILADGQGGNRAFLLAGEALHMLNLENGQITTQGPVQGLGSAEILDLAALR
jgi:hypothetical protein